MTSTAPIMCQLCTTRLQKYCCPRCNILYCSVECYKSDVHIQCSETFYKDCVLQEMALQSKKVNSTLDDIPGLSDDIKRMYAILKRMESTDSNKSDISDFDISDIEELDSDDEELDVDLADRLSGVDLDDANSVWKKLTTSERQDFENIIQAGEISKLVNINEPWWNYKWQKPLIEEVHTTNSLPTHPPNMPKIHGNISDFSSISTKPPAACVAHNLTNIIAAYTVAHRFFNGEHLSSPQETCNYLMAICANFKTNANFDDDQLALDSVAHDCRNEGLTIDKDQADVMRHDVQAILNGPDGKSNVYVLAALSDVHQLITLAKRSNPTVANSKKTKVNGEFSKRFMDHEIINFENTSKTKLNACLKKMEYFLAYVKKYR